MFRDGFSVSTFRNEFLSVSLEMDFGCLGGIVGVEKHWNRMVSA